MILEKQTEVSVLQEGTNDGSLNMSLDLDSAQILMQMLSKNLYSDAIGSSIRECASNALDSHRRAGIDKPIIVSFKMNSQGNYEFSVEDFGTGLDADDVKNIISKYGKSTKRQEANSLGMMGLGFKAPLAYSSIFHFIARKDGIERKYMMYEGEEINKIDLLTESPTTEPNGVKVIIPVQYSDRDSFEEKIQEQLAYFENVYFDVKVYSTAMDNDFVIHRAEHFQFSELAQDRNMHICLDNVYYPLDFAKLGIPQIKIPIGLKFSLTDGIFPTPNREAIRYTKEAKQIILDKISKVSDFFVKKYNESITEDNDIVSIFAYYESKQKYVTLINKPINITELLTYSTISLKKPALKGIKLLDLKSLTTFKHYILGEYKIKYNLYNKRLSETKINSYSNVNFHPNITKQGFLFEGRLSGILKTYLKDQLNPQENYCFIKKIKSFPLFPKNKELYNDYYTLLNLSKYNRSEWRQVIVEFQSIISDFIGKLTKVEEITISPKWLEDRKQKVLTTSTERKTKLKGEITCKEASNLLRYVEGQSCKFVPTTYKVEDIEKQPTLIVYAKHEDAKNLDKLYTACEKQKIKFITLSDREIKLLADSEIHNLITYEKFMEGTNKPFKRLVTAYLIGKLIEENVFIFKHSGVFNLLSKNLESKLNTLFEYREKNYKRGESSIYEAMLEVAINENLFDHEIFDTYLKVKRLIEAMPFMNILMQKFMRNHSYNDEPLLPSLRDLMKYHKFKLDYTCYEHNTKSETLTK